ncbi:hypothetical protein JD844_026053 [Phrynosoma platyrhinos]|uniref:Uncharacterized protein n=1 Tax=Phrynosoma platyrhinos TaxID=52577 RepID=A0ABQ7SEF7_PHRPL|nr:hypothetical protein JD844_026053 [Phrynosoma platyrhinos]
MVSVIIFSIAVLFIVYAVREWEKTAHLRHAMVMIKEFMIARDANFKGKEDPEIVLATDKVAKELASWAIMLNEIEAELDNIRFRLNHDWVAYRNAIYLLQDYGNPWEVLKELCKKEKADMVKVESEEEEVLGRRGAIRRVRYCIKIQSTLCDDSDKLQRHQAEVLGSCSLQ